MISIDKKEIDSTTIENISELYARTFEMRVAADQDDPLIGSCIATECACRADVVPASESTSGKIDTDDQGIRPSYLTPRPERSPAKSPNLDDHAQITVSY